MPDDNVISGAWPVSCLWTMDLVQCKCVGTCERAKGDSQGWRRDSNMWCRNVTDNIIGILGTEYGQVWREDMLSTREDLREILAYKCSLSLQTLKDVLWLIPDDLYSVVYIWPSTKWTPSNTKAVTTWLVSKFWYAKLCTEVSGILGQLKILWVLKRICYNHATRFCVWW